MKGVKKKAHMHGFLPFFFFFSIFRQFYQIPISGIPACVGLLYHNSVLVSLQLCLLLTYCLQLPPPGPTI